MADETWQPARLIPTSGISGAEEAETRATSALLAVLGAVREFGIAVLRPLGAPVGQIEGFIEVNFKLGDRTIRPDGVVQSTRGAKAWSALIEVKTHSNDLEREQIEAYLDVARENGIDVVLTISNHIAPAPGVHPVDVDKRKLRRVALRHLSWAEVLTVAVQQRVHRGVADPDQAWILGELIRYLENPRSGALDFSDMGAKWVDIRDAVAAGTLRRNDKGLPEVVSRWEQLLRFAALRLGRELGADVQVQVSRKEAADPGLRFAAQAKSLVDDGCLTGTLRIPDAVAPIDVVADVRSGRVTVSVDVDAPREGRPLTRLNWLTRQLRDAPDGLRVDAFVAGSRRSTSDLLRAVREDPNVLITDQKKEFRTFRVAATSALGTKRGAGRGGFIDSVLTSIDGFYEVVVQQLRPWSAKAPQLPKTGRTAAEEAGIDIEPPPSELEEPTERDIEAEIPPPEPEPPEIVEEAVANAPGEEVDAEGVAPAPSAEVVSWDHAQDRLDHERGLSAAPAVDSADDS
jgi:hypothetical protein